jgi:hypothetical protein
MTEQANIRDRDSVLADFVRNGSVCAGGPVSHDTGDSTIVVDGIDLDSLFLDIQSLGCDVIVQITRREAAA